MEGMELKRKRYRFKSYDQCFSGSDALDWVYKYLQNHPSYGTHITKEQAFMLLQKFMENKVFECVTRKVGTQKFQDSNCLYKFNRSDDGDIEEGGKDGNTMTIPSQNSITNLLSKVQSDLTEEKSETNGKGNSILSGEPTKTSGIFEPSDEENLDTIEGQNFFKRSNSLRLRKPLATLTNHALHKKEKVTKISKISTKSTNSTTMPPLKRSLNNQFAQTTDTRKRKSGEMAITTTTKNMKLSTKLFKSVTKNQVKNQKKVDYTQEQALSFTELNKMDISPVKTLKYRTGDIMQQFSPSPMRQKLRKTRSSSLLKYRSRSQNNLLSFGSDHSRQGLYKANSSWALNSLENSIENNFMLSKEGLSAEQLEETWKSVALLRHVVLYFVNSEFCLSNDVNTVHKKVCTEFCLQSALVLRIGTNYFSTFFTLIWH